MSFEWIVALVLLALALLLLIALLVRRPRVSLPPEWPERLQALEAAVQSTQLAVARNDGALAGMGEQLRAFTQTTQGMLDERLAQAREDARASRGELQAAFGHLQIHLEQLLTHARGEQTQALAAFRAELSATAQQLAADSVQSREGVAASTQAMGQRVQERFDALAEAMRGTLDSLKGDLHAQLGAMSLALKDQLGLTTQELTRQLSGLVASHQQGGEALRNALNERLAAIQTDNAARLEEMRRTVDEKLHATLEQRLGDSFKLVSERLEQVHAGLGEMKTLAGSVGDLKRVMSNVRARGTWGEVQLGAIIEGLLTAEQFARNVKTVPGSNDLVEYAIKMPGKSDEQPVWLPIDSKYPVEHYQRLIEAHESLDKVLAQQAATAFESSIRLEAKKIASKYVSPPHTTDFAILFLPTEGLFAEVCRVPGMVEALQNDYRVVVAGPTTLSAMLNSLRLGFRTLVIEKRSSEVWGILSTVKTEFRKFGDIVDATHKSIDAAANKFKDIGVRTRAIERKLRDVEELPGVAAPGVVTSGVADALGLSGDERADEPGA